MEQLTKEIKENYQALFGFSPSLSNIDCLNKKQWGEFCSNYNLNSNSNGIYIPRNNRIKILSSDPEYPLNLFHELFGHRLYHQFSLEGKTLRKIEERLHKEEKNHFKGKNFSILELEKFRNSISYARSTREISSIYSQEIFAAYSTILCAKMAGFEKEAKNYFHKYPTEMQRDIFSLIDFENKYGLNLLFLELGFPNYLTPDKVYSNLKKVFNKKLENCKLILQYGSKKPYSDIDIFCVSEEIKPVNTGRLDIQAISVSDLEEKLKFLDLAFAGPIMNGDFISGDKNYLEEKRIQILSSPTNSESIKYNLCRAKEQRLWSKNYPVDSTEHSDGIRYSKSYLKYALNLMQGRKVFSKKDNIY